jgi:hypothetical protein
MLDFVVERSRMRDVLIQCLRFMVNLEILAAPATPAPAPGP